MADNRVARVSLPVYLQALTIGFVAMGLLADYVAPRITVDRQSSKYRIFGKNSMVIKTANWAPGAIPNIVETRWSSDTYYAEIYKLRTLLLDAERANNASQQLGGVDLQAIYTQNVTNAIAIAREKRVADLFTTAANYATANKINKTGGAEWDTGSAGAQVLTDLITLAGTVADSAMVPMSELSVVIPEPVYRAAIMRNSAILDSIKYTQTGIVTQDLLAALIGVKEVKLSLAQTAGAGPEVAGSDVITGYTTTYLWGDTVWVGLIGQGQNQMQANFARSFNWTAATGGQVRQTRVYRTADEGQQADWIEVQEALDEKITFAGAGGIITNTLSTI